MGSLAQEVEALGGHLSLSTTEGAGTILSITIPWPQDPAAA
jgi:chemotaxis protein histidine kinase CheA